MENITAHENFFVLATMNPGGDYGKKELSPALRNRFTEIWVPPVCDLDELGDIASKRYVQLRKLSTGVVLAKQNQKLSFFNFNPFFSSCLQTFQSRTLIHCGCYAEVLGGNFCLIPLLLLCLCFC